ncbi:MAG TPA: OmpA family protein [Acidobacteriaceae bacterium]|nr:OmpA family protein [Acidobacteriaceae bacterium]
MHSRPFGKLGRILLAGCALGLGTTMVLAQNSSSSSAGSTGLATSTAKSDPSPSRMDVFLGYSYLAPHGTVTEEDSSTGSTFSNTYSSINTGAIGSFAYYFNRYVGAQAQFAISPDGNNDGEGDLGLGMIVRFPISGMTPFVHALAGPVDLGGPNQGGQSHAYTWGPALTVGGGLDYELPFANHHFALRLFQADYQYFHADFGPQPNTGGRANVEAARLSAGLVMHFGSIVPPPPVAYSCSASPDSVYPGEQVTVTCTATNLNPKKTTSYSWSGSQGLTVSGTKSTTTIDTTNLQPGDYTVTGHVTEGNKPGESADGAAHFTVKQFEPPTVSCTANPTTVQAGGTSTITATGVSPQNRTLTYSYSASAGSISGTTNTATLSTTGAPSGTITVTCNVQDDKGQTASTTSTVDVEAPPPPPPPPAPSPEQVRLEHRLALHSVFFPTNQPSPAHPERGLVESQRGTLRTLATDFQSYLAIKPNARITLTGHADVRGSVAYNQALTERRVNLVKQFLVEQGVPESAIDTQAVGKAQQLSKEQVLALVDENPDLTNAEKMNMDRNLTMIYLAQNRRVDITLNNTGQQSVKLYPFNAADLNTLLSEKAPARRKKRAAKQH